MGVLDFAGGTVTYECRLGSISWRNVLGAKKTNQMQRIMYY
jgi:hypothetical protein